MGYIINLKNCDSADCCNPWFVGFSDPTTFFKVFESRDWDSCLISGSPGLEPDTGFDGATSSGWLVDGHVTYQANGDFTATIIQSTGYFPDHGYAVGTNMAMSAVPVSVFDGAIVSNTQRNSSIMNGVCNNADGSLLYSCLFTPV